MFLRKYILISLLFSLQTFAENVDLTNIGGDLSHDNNTIVVLQLPAPNVTDPTRRDRHFAGRAVFHKNFEFTLVNGKRIAGPFLNHTTCGGCHFNDGKGPLKFSRTTPTTSVVVKVSRRGLLADGKPKDVIGVGEQLTDHHIKGGTRFNIRLRWKTINGTYPDGTKYSLRSPRLLFSIPGVNTKKLVTSIRQSPGTLGLGLLEAVPFSTLLAMSDPEDSNGDGISGRINYVYDLERKLVTAGRFGFRASQPTIRQQNAAAFTHDMGITNSIFPSRNKSFELSDDDLDLTTFYLQVASIHKAKNQSDPNVIAGKQLFQDLNCQSCHKMTLQTGTNSFPELSNQTFHPFTDLLLHDMGPGLADERPEFSASGSEWRTTPLWGLGLTEMLAQGQKRGFLHDGRARTIEEAILWHGGEAENARENFKSLNADERQQLIAFLKSI